MPQQPQRSRRCWPFSRHQLRHYRQRAAGRAAGLAPGLAGRPPVETLDHRHQEPAQGHPSEESRQAEIAGRGFERGARDQGLEPPCARPRRPAQQVLQRTAVPSQRLRQGAHGEPRDQGLEDPRGLRGRASLAGGAAQQRDVFRRRVGAPPARPVDSAGLISHRLLHPAHEARQRGQVGVRFDPAREAAIRVYGFTLAPEAARAAAGRPSRRGRWSPR